MHKVKTCNGVHKITNEKAIAAVDLKWLWEIEDDILGSTNLTLLEFIGHLRDWGCIKNIDIAGLKEEIDSVWDINKHIVKHIAKFRKL